MNNDLYAMLQDPSIPEARKRAVLSQIQQQAEPDSSLPATGAALVADAAAGTLAGKWLEPRAERYFKRPADWLSAHVGSMVPAADIGPTKPPMIPRIRNAVASSLTPKNMAHLGGNIVGGAGMGIIASMLVDSMRNKKKYQDPLGS